MTKTTVARVWLALALVLIVYGALFAGARRFEFVWADTDAIRDSTVYALPLSQQLRTSEHARMNPSLMELHGIVLTHESYRPLLILSHGLDLRLFGRNPGPMHLHNVLLGALCILAAFWLAARLFGDARPALAVTALFAFHPLHVEPICFLSARGDPLSGLLALVAAALVVEIAPPAHASAAGASAARAPRSRRATIALAVAAGVVFALSLFAKEANLLLPLALAGFALALGRLRAWRAGLIALAAAVPLYAAVRALSLGNAPAATHADRLVHAGVAFPAICVEYARSFVLPFDLSISRQLDVPLALGWAVAAAVAVAFVVALRRASASWRPALALAAAGLAWAALSIAPAAVAVFSEAAVADRYTYLAVFGFAVAPVALATQAARSWPQRRAAILVAGALFVALCVFVTRREIPVWATSGSLYAHAAEVEPHSAAAHNRTGRWYAEHHDWRDAVAEFEKAAVLPGANDRDLNNLGVGYLNVGRPRDAADVLRRAIERSHETSYHAWYNLGTAQRLLGERDAACVSFRRALAISPEYAHAREDLGRYCAPSP